MDIIVRVRGCDVGYGADDWIELKGRTSPWVPVFEPHLTEFNCRSHIAFMCLTAEITWNEFDSVFGISNLI